MICHIHGMERHILIIAEHAGSALSPLTAELITCARRLSGFLSPAREIKLILSTDDHQEAAAAARDFSVDVIDLQSGGHTQRPQMVYKHLPRDLLLEFDPEIILLAHTASGLEAAPAIAARLNAACMTGVENITVHENRLHFDRLIAGGKIMTRLTSNAPVTVCTIQPGLYEADGMTGPASPGRIIEKILPETEPFYVSKGMNRGCADVSNLKGADVIVAAGNGVREKEQLGLIRKLSELFPKSALAGSRPICDRKWLEYHQQVGITGAVVKPKLYLACGISGASQHIAGMKQSQFIVSINTDPRAAICNFSDICVVEDLATFIPAFIDIIQS